MVIKKVECKCNGRKTQLIKWTILLPKINKHEIRYYKYGHCALVLLNTYYSSLINKTISLIQRERNAKVMIGTCSRMFQRKSIWTSVEWEPLGNRKKLPFTLGPTFKSWPPQIHAEPTLGKQALCIVPQLDSGETTVLLGGMISTCRLLIALQSVYNIKL